MVENKDKTVVGFNGVCPICGSSDGMIVKSADGRFRNMCRVMGCPAFYRVAPTDGYSTQEEAANPFESELFKDGITGEEYLKGRNAYGIVPA